MNLYLTGLRGAGKTTTGRIVASRLGLPFVDLDEWIQQQAGRSVAEIFAKEGEPGFRLREAAALQETASRSGQVVALGGGTCIDPANRQRIRGSGRTVWLRGTPGELWDRIAADPATAAQRPDLGTGEGAAGLVRLLAERRDGYAACADLVLATGAATPEELAAVICRWWG